MAQDYLNYSFPLPPSNQNPSPPSDRIHLRLGSEESVCDNHPVERDADKHSPYFQDGSQESMLWYPQPVPPTIAKYGRGYRLQSKIERFRAIWFITILTGLVT